MGLIVVVFVFIVFGVPTVPDEGADRRIHPKARIFSVGLHGVGLVLDQNGAASPQQDKISRIQ